MLSKVFLSSIVLIFTFCQVNAQSTRYWSLNFSSETGILSGAVVGGGGGSQAIFYNPATIAESRTDKISLAADLVTLDLYRGQNLFGDGEELKETNFNVIPSFFSLTFQSRRYDKLTYEFVIFTRDETDVDIVEGGTLVGRLYESIDVDQRSTALWEQFVNYSDKWIGIGAAHRFNEHFSLGLSAFVSLKGLSDKLTRTLNVYPLADEVTVGGQTLPFFNSHASEIIRLDYSNIRFLFKFGAQYKVGRFDLGVNLTTPSLAISGSGEHYRELRISQILNQETATFEPDFIIVDYQEELSAQYKDPLSISFGINYNFPNNKTRLYFSGEYFASIDTYKLIEGSINTDIAPPSIYNQLENKEFLSIVEGNASVFNAAIGLRHRLTDRSYLLLGARTDFDFKKEFTAAPEFTNFRQLSNIFWNQYHFTGGARFQLGRTQLILGGQYTFGKDNDIQRFGNFLPELGEEDPDLPLEGRGEDASFSFKSFGLFFGFTFNFKGPEEEDKE